MALVHEFENSGNWLFKRRSWLPVFMVVAGIIVMYLGNRKAILFDMRDELIFLGVSILGQIIRILTVGFTPKNTSGRNTVYGQVADELNVTGIYSLLRHPLYLGNFFMWLGPVLFLRSFCFTLIFGLLYWLYYERIMFAEEQFLRRKFGEIYDKWSETVSSFIPYSLKFIPPKLPFSVRNVLKSERIYLTPMWIYISGSGFVIWIVARTIHKKTKWLEVKGR
jgi:protein-S-isoprenylcysteine O-methyltransferase Ste14